MIRMQNRRPLCCGGKSGGSFPAAAESVPHREALWRWWMSRVSLLPGFAAPGPRAGRVVRCAGSGNHVSLRAWSACAAESRLLRRWAGSGRGRNPVVFLLPAHRGACAARLRAQVEPVQVGRRGSCGLRAEPGRLSRAQGRPGAPVWRSAECSAPARPERSRHVTGNPVPAASKHA